MTCGMCNYFSIVPCKSLENVATTKWCTEAYKGRFVLGLPADGVGNRVLTCMIINLHKVLFWNSST